MLFSAVFHAMPYRPSFPAFSFAATSLRQAACFSSSNICLLFLPSHVMPCMLLCRGSQASSQPASASSCRCHVGQLLSFSFFCFTTQASLRLGHTVSHALPPSPSPRPLPRLPEAQATRCRQGKCQPSQPLPPSATANVTTAQMLSSLSFSRARHRHAFHYTAQPGVSLCHAEVAAFLLRGTATGERFSAFSTLPLLPRFARPAGRREGQAPAASLSSRPHATGHQAARCRQALLFSLTSLPDEHKAKMLSFPLKIPAVSHVFLLPSCAARLSCQLLSAVICHLPKSCCRSCRHCLSCRLLQPGFRLTNQLPGQLPTGSGEDENVSCAMSGFRLAS